MKTKPYIKFSKKITSIILSYCLLLWQLQPSVVYARRGNRPDNDASRNRERAQRARDRGNDTTERTPEGRSDTDASRNRERAQRARDRGQEESTSDSQGSSGPSTSGVPGLSDKGDAALNNIGKLNLFSEKGSKLVATDEQRQASQKLKAEAIKLFYEACKAQMMLKQKENLGALRSLTSNLAESTSAISEQNEGLSGATDDLRTAAKETNERVRNNTVVRNTRISDLFQACEDSNCGCRQCAGRASGEGQEGASCSMVCSELKKLRSADSRIDSLTERTEIMEAGTQDAQNGAQDGVSDTVGAQNTANAVREGTFQAVSSMISGINERAGSAIALAKQARAKAMESIGALNSDYVVTNAMMDDMRVAGVANAEQTGVMASAAFDLCCRDISDVRCVSYHLYTAAASIYVASQIIDASDYSKASKNIMSMDIDPNQEMNNQVENLRRAQMLREEMVKSAETIQQGKDSITQMMTYVRMVAEQEIETAEARQDNAKEAADNTSNIMQMAMMAMKLADMIGKMDVGKQKAACAKGNAVEGKEAGACGSCGGSDQSAKGQQAQCESTGAKQAAQQAKDNAKKSWAQKAMGKMKDTFNGAKDFVADKVQAGGEMLTDVNKAIGGLLSGGSPGSGGVPMPTPKPKRKPVIEAGEVKYTNPSANIFWEEVPLGPIYDFEQNQSYMVGFSHKASDMLSDLIFTKANAAVNCAPCPPAKAASKAADGKSAMQKVKSMMSIAMMVMMLMQMLKGMKGKKQAHKEQMAANIHGHMKCDETSPGAGLNCALSVLKSSDHLLATVPPTESTKSYGKREPVEPLPPEDDSNDLNSLLIPDKKSEKIVEFEKKWGSDLFMMSVMLLSSYRGPDEGMNEYLKVLDLSRAVNGANSSLPHTYKLFDTVVKKAKFISGRFIKLVAEDVYAADGSPADGNNVKLQTMEELEASLGVMKGTKAFTYYQQHRSTATTLSKGAFETPQTRADYLGMVETQGEGSMTDMMDALDDASLYDDQYNELIDNFDTNDALSMELGDGGLDAVGDGGFDEASGGLSGVGSDSGGPGGGLGTLGGVDGDSTNGSGSQAGGLSSGSVGGDSLGGQSGGSGGPGGVGGMADVRGGAGGASGTGGDSATGSGGSSVGIGGAGSQGAGGTAGGSNLGRTNVSLGAGGSTRTGSGKSGRKGMGSTSASARNSMKNISKMGTLNPNTPMGRQIEAMKALIDKTKKGLMEQDGRLGGLTSDEDVRKKGSKILAVMRQASIEKLKRDGKFDELMKMRQLAKGKRKYRGPKGNVGSLGSLTGGSSSDYSSGSGGKTAAGPYEAEKAEDAFDDGDYSDDYGDGDGDAFGDMDSGDSFSNSKDDYGRGGINAEGFGDNEGGGLSAEERYRRNLLARNKKDGKFDTAEINQNAETSIFKIVTQRYKQSAYPIFYDVME
ncbi:MAG: hypothetical protein ISR65_01460 [Bacteriovoracaceae bacterium]|nr:hypothetical protein [Bacteriovoracaceae bacterium]